MCHNNIGGETNYQCPGFFLFVKHNKYFSNNVNNSIRKTLLQNLQSDIAGLPKLWKIAIFD